MLGGHQSVARYLLDAGADPNVKDANQWSALSKASAIGDLAMVQFLVKRGAETASKDDHEFTPFQKAVQNVHHNIFAYFRELGPRHRSTHPKNFKSRRHHPFNNGKLLV